MLLYDSTPVNEKCFCPDCGIPNFWATPTQAGAVPTPGDYAVCAYCCALLTYTDELTLIELTEEVLEQIKRIEPKVWANLTMGQWLMAEHLAAYPHHYK